MTGEKNRASVVYLNRQEDRGEGGYAALRDISCKLVDGPRITAVVPHNRPPKEAVVQSKKQEESMLSAGIIGRSIRCRHLKKEQDAPTWYHLYSSGDAHIISHVGAQD